jgi:hypothetical protein
MDLNDPASPIESTKQLLESIFGKGQVGIGWVGPTDHHGIPVPSWTIGILLMGQLFQLGPAPRVDRVRRRPIITADYILHWEDEAGHVKSRRVATYERAIGMIVSLRTGYGD